MHAKHPSHIHTRGRPHHSLAVRNVKFLPDRIKSPRNLLRHWKSLVCASLYVTLYFLTQTQVRNLSPWERNEFSPSEVMRIEWSFNAFTVHIKLIWKWWCGHSLSHLYDNLWQMPAVIVIINKANKVIKPIGCCGWRIFCWDLFIYLYCIYKWSRIHFKDMCS